MQFRFRCYRTPDQGDTFQLQHRHLWRVPDAMARITQMLAAQPRGGALGRFLPVVDGVGPEKELLCRAAVASTFFGGLELAREGAVALIQEQPGDDVRFAKQEHGVS